MVSHREKLWEYGLNRCLSTYGLLDLYLLSLYIIALCGFESMDMGKLIFYVVALTTFEWLVYTGIVIAYWNYGRLRERLMF